MQSKLESFLIKSERDLIALVFNNLPLVDIIRLKFVSRFVGAVISFYLQRQFSFDAFFDKWFEDTQSFRSILHRSGAVVSGSQALQFFDRAYYSGSDLDIFVRIGGLDLLEKWLRREGYIPFVQTHGNPPRWSHYMEIRAAEQKALFNKSSHQRPLYGVFNFKSSPACLVFPKVEQVIQIIVVDTDPISHILFNFHSTAVINYITADRAVSVFPRQTLFHRESYLTAAHKTTPDWVHKYVKRGFKIIHRDNFATASDPHDVTAWRFPGDSECFIVQFTSAQYYWPQLYTSNGRLNFVIRKPPASKKERQIINAISIERSFARPPVKLPKALQRRPRLFLG